VYTLWKRFTHREWSP